MLYKWVSIGHQKLKVNPNDEYKIHQIFKKQRFEELENLFFVYIDTSKNQVEIKNDDLYFDFDNWNFPQKIKFSKYYVRLIFVKTKDEYKKIGYVFYFKTLRTWGNKHLEFWKLVFDKNCNLYEFRKVFGGFERDLFILDADYFKNKS